MKKLLFGALALIVLVLAGGPVVFGFLLERELNLGYKETPYAEFVELHVDDYQRGFYSSTAKVRVAPTEGYINTITQGLGDSADMTTEELEVQAAVAAFMERMAEGLSFDAELRHGPVSFQDDGFFGMGVIEMTVNADSPAVADLQESLQIPYLFKDTTRVRFDGSGDSVAVVPAFVYSGDDGDVSYTGATMSGDYSADMKSVRYDADLGSIEGVASEGTFKVNDMRLDGNTEVVARLFGIGKTNFSIDSMEFSSPMQSATVEKISMVADMRLNDTRDRVDMDLIYKVDAVSGLPGAELRDLQLGFEFLNLDLEAMQSYMDAIIPAEAAEPVSEEEFALQIAGAMYDVIRESAEIGIDPLSFSLNDDRFDSEVHFLVDGSKLPEFEQLEGDNQQALLEAIAVSARVSAAENLVMMMAQTFVSQQIAESIPPDSEVSPEEIQAAIISQTPVFIDSLVQQGLLTKGDEGYSGELEYAQGQLQLNGVEVPLGAMLQ